MDRQRVYANNPTFIADHFKKLGEILRQKTFKPYAISNVAEKGIILGYSAKSKVITKRCKKTPYVKQHGQPEMVTLIEAGYTYQGG